jgi:hypothetical protein
MAIAETGVAITETGSSRSVVRPVGRDLSRSEGAVKLGAT